MSSDSRKTEERNKFNQVTNLVATPEDYLKEVLSNDKVNLLFTEYRLKNGMVDNHLPEFEARIHINTVLWIISKMYESSSNRNNVSLELIEAIYNRLILKQEDVFVNESFEVTGIQVAGYRPKDGFHLWVDLDQEKSDEGSYIIERITNHKKDHYAESIPTVENQIDEYHSDEKMFVTQYECDLAMEYLPFRDPVAYEQDFLPLLMEDSEEE
jgi:hypothetical protein